MTELEKMRAGEFYDANFDQELTTKRYTCMDKCLKLNTTSMLDNDQRNEIIKDILGYLPEDLEIVNPFICDYGTNIKMGKRVNINANNYFMDGAPITIGDDAFIGPFCGFYTASHPLDHERRNRGLEQAKPITIGDSCWLGANVSVMPGVTIGDHCVIGAGSVVTKDIPDNSLAVGIPAKVIKKID